MKLTILPYKFENQYFYISPLTGNLVVSHQKINQINFAKQLKNNIWYNDFPYKLDPLTSISFEVLNETILSKLKKYNNNLLWLGNKNFFLSCLYSRLNIPIFENTVSAFDHIAELKIHKEMKGKICLQRSLLAAKTSNSFKKNGTLFIGAQLPTGIMHAWIIENGIQPDRQDREWIMYKPLLAITF